MDPFADEPKATDWSALVLVAFVLVLLIAGGFAWNQHQEDQVEKQRQQELDEGVCDLLVNAGQERSFEECMRGR